MVPSTQDESKVLDVDGLSNDSKYIVDFSGNPIPEGHVTMTRVKSHDGAFTSQVFVVPGNLSEMPPMLFRVAKIKDKYYLLDKFRSFITFVTALEKTISSKKMSPVWDITDYMKNLALSSSYPDDFE